ncbi:MAG: PAS domain S-box protein [Bacteroidota bacterium]
MHTRLELYHKVTPLAKIGIWERDLRTNKVYWNDMMRVIYDLPPDFIPEFGQTLQYYNDPEVILRFIEKAIESRQPQTSDFLIKTIEDKVKWVKISIHASYEDEQCLTTFGTMEDITSYVDMINLLEENEQRFHHAFDYAPIGMAIVALNGSWIRVNKSLMALLGYGEFEFLDHTFQDFTHPEDLDYDLNLVKQLIAGGIESYNIEKRYIHKEGNIVWANLSVSIVRDQFARPLYFISQIVNMTERQKHSEILLLERKRLDNIIKSTRVGTWEWDIVTDKINCNKRAANILGYERFELYNGIMKTWMGLIHPEDLEIFTSQLELCIKREKKYFAAECRMSHKNGTWQWLEIRGKVVSWRDEKPLFLLGTCADIHERKSLEQEKEDTLKIIKEQNARLLNFTHIVSHNLRSHSGNMQMLLEALRTEDDQEEKNKLFDMLVINSDNLQETLSNLNDVVKISDTGAQNVKQLSVFREINRILASLSKLIQNAGAEIHIDANESLVISYDPAYFESILLNLISNAIKYRDAGRQLRIKISATRLQNKCVLEIQDNGIGIDLELHGHKIFGMYKTFHGNNDAKGLGLFIIKNQIDAMGGKIEVQSTPGSGTSFKIEIN